MSSTGLLQLAALGLLAASVPLLWVWIKGDTDKYRKIIGLQKMIFVC